MSFFQDIDGLSLLERNSSRLEGIEMNEARKLIKQYKTARQQLKMQLLMSPDNTFTEAKLSQTLAQVEAGLSTLSRMIKPTLMESFGFVSEQGIEDSAKEINYFDKMFKTGSIALPIDQIVLSTEPENILLNQYESSIASYSQSLRNKFQSALTQSLIQRKTWSQTVWDMDQVFEQDEWQLARIVRTELHGIYNNAKNGGYATIQDKYIPDLKKTLYHPMDSRTGNDSKAAASKQLIVNIDEPFRYSFIQGGKTVTREFFTPPDRPNDRSILIPYRQAWDN